MEDDAIALNKKNKYRTELTFESSPSLSLMLAWVMFLNLSFLLKLDTNSPFLNADVKAYNARKTQISSATTRLIYVT